MSRMRKVVLLLVILPALTIGLVSFQDVSGKYFEIAKQIEIFANLYKEINTYYVDDLEPATLMKTGVDAMLGSLDPYTNYISETQIEGYRYMTEGKYHGIGATTQKMGDYVTIIDLYQTGPAYKAGLKIGDQITEVDGYSAMGKSKEEVEQILKGYPGTDVQLTISRPGQKEPIKLKLIREDVKVPNVPYKGMVNNEVGYISLSTFTRQAGQNVGVAMLELKNNNPELKGLILDLRYNGGGLLGEAVELCNLFVPQNKLIVSTKGKVIDWDRSYKTTKPATDEEIPLTVLINHRSASASEIVSGVMQDYDRAVLIGQRSYGKGLVQNTKDIGYNAKVKMTTAKYYIPSGRCIQAVKYDDGEPVDIADSLRAEFKTENGRTVLDGGGIKPDIVVKKPVDAPVLQALENQHLIFDYVTQFTLTHDSIAAPGEFEFTAYEEFKQFVNNQDFTYQSESEKLLDQLETETDREDYASVIGSDLEQLQSKITEAKSRDLERHREEIIRQIEEEIIGRYYFHKGKLQHGLQRDQEIKEAIAVLKDKERYNKILGR